MTKRKLSTKIIEADSTGHLYFVLRDDSTTLLDLEPIFELNEQDGTVFCLEGNYRYYPYYHAVSEVSQRRISITFRTVEFLKTE